MVSAALRGLWVGKILEFMKSIANGVKQHSAGWHIAKKYTVGGSQMAIIQGVNPYSNINKMIAEKCGITMFQSDIKVQWGNLFEAVIKAFVEAEHDTTIYGSDIYISAVDNVSYSPDGIGVIDIDGRAGIALFEFKCPFSRIPTGVPPEYYVPQVKTGLCMIPIVDFGVFVEGVFRRCAWGDLGPNEHYDLTLTTKVAARPPQAFGFIGFYYNRALASKNMTQPDTAGRKFGWMMKLYREAFEVGNKSNNYMTNDLGDCARDLFVALMKCHDLGLLEVWYGPMVRSPPSWYDALRLLNASLSEFEGLCRANDWTNMGILPWKLFNVHYNVIDKEADYLEPWKEKISEIIDVVRACDADEANKHNIYSNYVARTQADCAARTEGGFI